MQAKQINFPAAHQSAGLWSKLRPDTHTQKQDDKWFCHLIRAKEMKDKLSKPPRVTEEHEMIFSCGFDGLDNTRWQWMRRSPDREHAQVWRACCVCLQLCFLPLFVSHLSCLLWAWMSPTCRPTVTQKDDPSRIPRLAISHLYNCQDTGHLWIPSLKKAWDN